MGGLEIKKFTGRAIKKALSDLAALRIAVFREYPYLYDGTIEYEREYLQTYIKSQKSILAAVYDGNRMVGATTACPLADEVAAFKKPFENARMDTGKIFYFAESVLLPQYRGRGLYKEFFALREERARETGDYNLTTFCGVVRPPDHPSKPPDYVPLDAYWTRMGYQKRADLKTTFTWRETGQSEESGKTMIFWTKELSRP